MSAFEPDPDPAKDAWHQIDWRRKLYRVDCATSRRFRRPVPYALFPAFERIHAFLDGNGRVGRLLMNLVLVRLGYPPAIIQKRERERYLDALARADRGDPGPLGELIARAILDNLTRLILPAVAGPSKLLPLEALATKDVKVIALRNAARRSRLKAIKASDGSWRSSKQWVEEYRDSRYATLREPRKRKIPQEAAKP